MKERPIIFNGEMVRAILDGRKTQTRRVMVRQPIQSHWATFQSYRETWKEVSPHSWIYIQTIAENPNPDQVYAKCPYAVGQQLWVREKWGWSTLASMQPHPAYSQFLIFPSACRTNDAGAFVRWRPSIHMPRWASRITLEVVGVRVERVQDIGEADAKAEGLILIEPRAWIGTRGNFYTSPVNAFRDLWDSINAKRGYSWDMNPWVWVIEFKRVL